MKKLLFIVLFGVLAVSCENLLPNELELTPNTVFVTDSNDAYIIEVAGGELVVTITTNVDYSIVIPEEAKSWLSVADTRAEARMEKQTFIIAENDTFETRLANVEFVDGDGKVLKTILFSQKCDDKVFATDAEGNYLVKAEGGEVQVAVTTNLEYSVVIPTEAQKWLSVADTRAEIREETLTFIVAENETFKERSANVKLVDSKGDVLQTIGFIQSAVEMCPSNEIWYTNGSTTESTYPNNPDAFGVNIISNTFDAEKACWIIKFDGDVTTIGEGAFWVCSSLTSVMIPGSVTTIGSNAFSWCEGLTSVTIPESVTTIGVLAFDRCSSLRSVTIPDSVTTIESGVFSGCSSLTSVTIPDSVTELGRSAFSGCNNLTRVTIGDGVTTIGAGAFNSCSSLREFNGKYASEDGRCLIIDGTLNSFAPAGLTEYTISDSVTTIGEYAFSDCSSITGVTIGDSVTTIEDYAFDWCSNLRSVSIPDIVTSIGNYAFAYCSRLTSVTIPDSLTSIGEYTFFLCSSLTSVTIPDSVTTIGGSAFSLCSSLTSVTIPDSVTTIGATAFSSCSSLTSVTIPDSVTTIGDYAFSACSSLTSATIPDSVTTIGECAFRGCSSLREFNGKYVSEDGRCLIIDGTLNSFAPAGLTEYTISDSVTTIGEYAFSDCSSLTSVTIPDSVTTIGAAAFSSCSSLTSVTIPDSVTIIGSYAFADCSSLTSVYCKATTPPTAYSAYYLDWYAFEQNASGRKIYVPTESVEAYKSAIDWSDYADAIEGYNF